MGRPASNAAKAGSGGAAAAAAAAASAREAPGGTAWSVGQEQEEEGQGQSPVSGRGSSVLSETLAPSPPSGGRYRYPEGPSAGLYGAGSPYSDSVLVGDGGEGDGEELGASRGLGPRYGEDAAAAGAGLSAVKAFVPSSLSPLMPQAARPEVFGGAAAGPLSHQLPHAHHQYHQHQQQDHYDQLHQHQHPGSAAASTPAGTARRIANSRTAASAATFEPFSPPIHIPPLPHHHGDQGQEHQQAAGLTGVQQQHHHHQQGGPVSGSAGLSRSEGGAGMGAGQSAGMGAGQSAGMGAGQSAAPGPGVTDRGVSERRRTAGSPEPGRTGANAARRLSLEHVRAAGQGVVGGRVASPSGVPHAMHTWVP